jgi:hypothetical protein
MQGNQGDPPGGFGRPPASAGFGPSQSGGFGAPPGGGFGAPPGGGFGAPPGGGFGAPPGGGFGPPSDGGFGAPPGGEFGDGPPAPVDPLAITSTVLGALSVFLCCCTCIGIPLALGGAATGAVALSNASRPGSHPTSKTLAIVGLSLSGFALLLDVASFFLNVGATVMENLRNFR